MPPEAFKPESGEYPAISSSPTPSCRGRSANIEGALSEHIHASAFANRAKKESNLAHPEQGTQKECQG
jgi:hypothetical protein